MSSVLVSAQQQAFARHFNRASFQFDHTLGEQDVFRIPNLVAMAGRLAEHAYFSTAESSVDDGWKNVGDGRLTLQETLESLGESNSLVLLSHCETDPECGDIFRNVLDDVVEQVGDALRNDVDIARATLVISSPRRVTSYHIDAEVNFLLQIRGEKSLHVFDPHDKSVLADDELEAFYGGDWDGARYKSECRERAQIYALQPGVGVHMPRHAPHWAQNGDAVSIGLSLNFNLRSAAAPTAVYKVNGRLRKAGLTPAAPGLSPLQDELKVAAFRGASLAKSLLRRGRTAGDKRNGRG
jgi:hypothetical protein